MAFNDSTTLPRDFINSMFAFLTIAVAYAQAKIGYIGEIINLIEAILPRKTGTLTKN